MRNVIVFINVCILAVVAMLSLGPKQDSSSATRLATGSKEIEAGKTKAGSTSSSLLTSSLTAGSERANAAGRRSLGENERAAVKDFVLEMNQQHLLDRQQSLIAIQRGTARSLKEYGSWMAIHQQQMLDDLAKLARHHGIATSSTLDPSGISELSELQKLHGRNFDARYIKAMTATLKQDLKQFERASYSPDPDVQVFATRYMRVTQDNLSKIQEIRRTYRKTR